MVGIYKILNKINNKVYIGQSVNIEVRWSSHRSRPYQVNSSQYNCPLYRAIRKYGLSNFEFSILEECSKEKLNEREIFYISQFQANDSSYGYNLTAGGDSPTTESKISPTELKQIQNLLINTNISEQQIALQFNISQRAISAINLGEYHLDTSLTYPLRKKQKNVSFCKDCGKILKINSSIRCPECSAKNLRLVERPSREQLKEEIYTQSFTKLGAKYGVSDNAIKKWCISYNLPSKKKEIKKYSKEEWSKI